MAGNYETLTAEVMLSISKAQGTLTVPETTVQRILSDETFSLDRSTNGDGEISYVSDNENVALVSADGTVAVEGVWRWKDTLVVPTVGNRGYTAVFTPEDTVNYNIVECTVTVEVKQAPITPTTTPSVTVLKTQRAKNALPINAGLKVRQTGNKIMVEWGQVSGADGYDVYVQYCGKKTKIRVKRVNGEKLDLKKNYWIYVRAWQLVNGKKVSLGRSINAHITGRENVKYTNVRGVKIKKRVYRLKKGKTATIKTSTVLVRKRKRKNPSGRERHLYYSHLCKEWVCEKVKVKVK